MSVSHTPNQASLKTLVNLSLLYTGQSSPASSRVWASQHLFPQSLSAGSAPNSAPHSLRTEQSSHSLLALLLTLHHKSPKSRAE